MNYEHDNKKEKQPVIRASLFYRWINPSLRLLIGGVLGSSSIFQMGFISINFENGKSVVIVSVRTWSFDRFLVGSRGSRRREHNFGKLGNFRHSSFNFQPDCIWNSNFEAYTRAERTGATYLCIHQSRHQSRHHWFSLTTRREHRLKFHFIMTGPTHREMRFSKYILHHRILSILSFFRISAQRILLSKPTQ